MFKKRFPTPQEFKEVWQPKKWARNEKKSKKALKTLLDFIADILRKGDNKIGADAISYNVSRVDLDAALAERGWKLRMPDTWLSCWYEIVPLDSETTEEAPF